MPSTIFEVDNAGHLLNQWQSWPVPEMPAIQPEAAPWAWDKDAFWRQPVTKRPVDLARTAALPGFDTPVGTSGGSTPWQGTVAGMPFQIVSSRGVMTKVWDLSRAPTWSFDWIRGFFRTNDPIFELPLPNVVRREGDPAPTSPASDMHWYGWDPTDQVLYEAITLDKSWANRFKTWGTTEWTVSYGGGGQGVSRWDCHKPWNATGQPGGVVAAGIPQFPMIVRWDEIERGRIDHAVFGVLPNYNPGKVGPARASDGDWATHPVRAGERLRLKRSAVERFAPGTPGRTLAEACWEFGWVQGDRNGVKGCSPTVRPGGFPVTQDRRMRALDGWQVKLSDWEVLAA